MKIYTKRGDSGDTSLFGGERISKSAERIKAYGNVDELNSFVGLAASYDLSEQGTELLSTVQEMLFKLGADLATPPSSKTRIDRISEQDITFLEDAIDELEENLEPLKNFILPGGSQPGATLHVARTVCRRAERATVACQETDEISDNCVKFLNRLSDFLFVIARYENKHAGVREESWQPERNDQ
ncbi:cob(I)yrinic acid a,c-diamide adenosyltransferase [Fodinibius halophilus]|uniref:Corrinoid adenosyltransferase n=1 Tax=Fodinibius halophilus TaxID=1736908 RepID=A0A6M1T4N0_9BACT|nr:cob(I)yrinic acid a,c-diamide adenosyltransferase [Fodinibius halophilus]NGP88205.1 cob(I)yrinic acid a,c-diamide adenosyltransferase [Fodinibius halophilus]